ncbi:MAG: DUF4442 domain-containing protein [Thermodesulfobacteriota bacterium]|nr:DUF4442 domain-containing protein [Thermodesulfobacteriota bacterium]
MGESLKTYILRHIFNFFPAFRRTGGRIVYFSSDWDEIQMKLPLNWKTRNYVGTMYGGSMYAAIDGIYMVMLINLLGKRYIVWDKRAEIKYLKPGKGTLETRLRIDKKELSEIKRLLKEQRSIERIYTIEWKDRAGDVCSVIHKHIYIKNKN